LSTKLCRGLRTLSMSLFGTRQDWEKLLPWIEGWMSKHLRL